MGVFEDFFCSSHPATGVMGKGKTECFRRAVQFGEIRISPKDHLAHNQQQMPGAEGKAKGQGKRGAVFPPGTNDLQLRKYLSQRQFLYVWQSSRFPL